MLLHILISGYPPFMGSNNHSILHKISHGKFTFRSVEWKQAPVDLKSFIHHMLSYDPDRRYTVKECLDHPWLARMEKQPGAGYYIAVDCFNNLRVFVVSLAFLNVYL